MELNPATGEQLGSLLAVEGLLPGPLGLEQVGSFDWAADGEHAVYEVVDSEAHGTIWRWDGGRPERTRVRGAYPTW